MGSLTFQMMWKKKEEQTRKLASFKLTNSQETFFFTKQPPLKQPPWGFNGLCNFDRKNDDKL
jgi:hypothetical protein